MKIKKIRKIKVNSCVFKISWSIKTTDSSVDFKESKITIGTKGLDIPEIFDSVCHELLEIAAADTGVRLDRPDCDGDYVFVYDHRQHDTMCNMFAGMLSQFIK